MKKVNLNDKFNAILSYFFLLHFFSYLSKNKSSFLKKHIKKGQLINLIILVWLIIGDLLNRLIIDFLPFSTNISNIISLFLLFLNLIFYLLILFYQIHSIIKVAKS